MLIFRDKATWARLKSAFGQQSQTIWDTPPIEVAMNRLLSKVLRRRTTNGKPFLRGQIMESSSSPAMVTHPYVAGGYHPVKLGDRFQDRYLVLRKLGFGKYSTVWLAQDER